MTGLEVSVDSAGFAMTSARNHCFRTRPLTRLASRSSSAKPAAGSGISMTVLGTLSHAEVLKRSKSAGSTSLLAWLASGIWHHPFMSSKGNRSNASASSLAHSFSRSFFFAPMRE
eukprot:CAMPEP_0180818674 /NCGR_PEP_ID=MMETSP1038_2-20121128/69334_1 /TAXON_ID=632150 /ORGANISM="Azadinium spinosum, Strain 3D9" /LENGTH=114 /DNA_ID=CAMNT_0022860627 /DNA_START=51 /DNA_END=395 /DNA_ORIENTATION=+